VEEPKFSSYAPVRNHQSRARLPGSRLTFGKWLLTFAEAISRTFQMHAFILADCIVKKSRLTNQNMSYNIGHMKKPVNLGDFEQVMLLAILRLKARGAYGVSIREEITRHTSRSPTPGAIYTTLERLEDKGLVKSVLGEVTAERGGRAKRYYTVTGAGMIALERTQREYRNLMQGLNILGRVHG
jgi:PadR family transcriptional regulator PadR